MGMVKLDKNKFIERIENIFGVDKFDYSLLEYNGAHTKVKIICKNCGNIENKDPTNFYKGFGCLKCNIRRPNPKQITKDQFINRSKIIHGEKYDYSKMIFIDLYNNVEIICPHHGSFYTKPTIHMHFKSNCPECRTSKGEEQIGIWLNNQNKDYKFQYNVKINNSNHYFDFYIPKDNLIIEFNGEQHYKPVKFFGGDKGYTYLQERDKIKINYCIENNINILIISYSENLFQKLEEYYEKES